LPLDCEFICFQFLFFTGNKKSSFTTIKEINFYFSAFLTW
jgi:hypothetical protein